MLMFVVFTSFMNLIKRLGDAANLSKVCSSFKKVSVQIRLRRDLNLWKE
jgi:hypothetical protein